MHRLYYFVVRRSPPFLLLFIQTWLVVEYTIKVSRKVNNYTNILKLEELNHAMLYYCRSLLYIIRYALIES